MLNKSNSNRAEFFLRLLAWFCPPHLYEGIEGDILEQFEDDLKTVGEHRAKRRFAWNVVKFFRPGILMRNKFSLHFMYSVMINNYIKIATRNIQKRKLYSFINAFGLSIGIAFCILIYLFIQDEKSFDQFHANKNFLYRMHGVEFKAQRNGGSKSEPSFAKMSHMPIALADVMKAELPEVELATRFCSNSDVLHYKEKVFREPIVYVDADFFNIFSFSLLQGNPKKIFQTNDEIVLTPEISRKYFGDINPVGETVVLGDRQLTVTGIIDSPPANSSLSFSILVPLQGWGAYNPRNIGNWRNMGFPTFVKLHDNARVKNFNTNLEKITAKYMGEMLVKWRADNEVPSEYKPYEISFTKITDIHFQKEISWDRVSDPQYSWILGAIAILILLIACINYISLALTTSARRRIEVGIRKVIGAQKLQLVYQFGFESIMLALISMVIGIGLVVLFLPVFNEFTGKSITISLNDFISLSGAGLCITLLVGIVAGSYPALFLSSFQPARVLKGTSTAKLNAGFAKPLVVLQFACSAFLIISCTIMYRQMQYLTTKDLGYNQDQIVVIPTQQGWGEENLNILERFRQKTADNPSVHSVAGTDYPFATNDYMIYGYSVDGEDKATYGYTVDPFFIRTMGMKLVNGRDFDPNNPADATKTVIVNEALVKDMKWKDPLNEHLRFHGRDTTDGSRVIGVVKDFHFLSLERAIEPMFLTADKNDGRLSYILVKISPNNIPATLEQFKKDFAEVAPNKPFEYTFMDENVEKQYAAFNRWMNIMGLATMFAVLISCLGLFGLAGINAVNRTKEIGIRKVMGADVSAIFMLLNKQFVWLSLLAFVLATPPSFIAMNKWLANFQFHIAVGWELIALSIVGGLLVALCTVSFHAIKAARINPAETLKYE
jgi:putative ABC transport system permease protein